jgi:hypothetical protein
MSSCKKKFTDVDMTLKKIKQKRNELTNILQRAPEKRTDGLIKLAQEVGASTIRMGITTGNVNEIPHNVITESEIVSNINMALQTASMLVMSKAAIWAAITASVSALAAWAAVLVNYMRN